LCTLMVPFPGANTLPCPLGIASSGTLYLTRKQFSKFGTSTRYSFILSERTR